MKQFPEIKICGITNFSDAEKSIALGVDYLGFIQYPKSPRFINSQRVSEILDRLKGYDFKKILVDVNPDPEKLDDYHQMGFDYYQLHFSYDLNESRIESWGQQVGKENLWLAPRMPTGSEFPDHLIEFADHFLLDAFSEYSFGGTGNESDWQEFSNCQKKYPAKKWILAGGLGLDNAKEAYNILRPEIMDFNSAIELEPGQKDHQKLDSLFTILRP